MKSRFRFLGFVTLLIMMFVFCIMAVPAFADEVAKATPDIFLPAGFAAIAIPFIIGLLKKHLKLPTGWCPFVTLIIGAIVGAGAFFTKQVGDLTLIQALMAGIAVGGTSTGFYDVKKKIQEAIL